MQAATENAQVFELNGAGFKIRRMGEVSRLNRSRQYIPVKIASTDRCGRNEEWERAKVRMIDSRSGSHVMRNQTRKGAAKLKHFCAVSFALCRCPSGSKATFTLAVKGGPRSSAWDARRAPPAEGMPVQSARMIDKKQKSARADSNQVLVFVISGNDS